MATGHPNSADCIGLWRMDEADAWVDADDESATNNTLTRNNDPWRVVGLVNLGAAPSAGARRLNEANCYFYFENPAPCDYCDLTQFTISTYVYYSGTPPAGGKKSIIFLLQNAVGPNYNIAMYLDENNFLNIVYNTSGGGVVTRTSPRVLSSGWHHVCYTYYTTNAPSNTTRVRLYVDNITDYTLDEVAYHGAIGCSGGGLATPLYLGGANVPIGLGLDAASSYWRGYLDEVAWYNTEKDAAWVGDRYVDVFGTSITPIVNCSLPNFSSDFTINHNICLLTQHKKITKVGSTSYGERTFCVPIALGTPGVLSLRNRQTPPSSSF